MTGALIITGGLVVDPAGAVVQKAITVEGDRLVSLTNGNADYIDASGKFVAPGIVEIGRAHV